MESLDLSFQPLTPDRWDDLGELFGPHGASGGCWCMWWRLPNAEFEKQKGEGNKQALKQIINKGEIPGILAYDGNKPVGWCSVAPRSVFTRLERSRILKPIDQLPVWSIVCFFVAKPYRRKGLTVHLLKAAVQYAQQQGARVVEGYPIDPPDGQAVDAFAYPGLASAFQQAGFKEILRRSTTRPIMRYQI